MSRRVVVWRFGCNQNVQMRTVFDLVTSYSMVISASEIARKIIIF